MNQDVFIEKIVLKKWSSLDYLKVFAIIMIFFLINVGLLIVGINLPIVQSLFPFLLIGTGVGAYFFLTSLRYEYEYSVTNDELTIEKIIAKRKRKRVYSGSCKNFSIMAPIRDPEFKDYARKNLKELDCSAGDKSDKVWFFVTKMNKEEILFYFEPDERFIKALRKFNPRGIKLN